MNKFLRSLFNWLGEPKPVRRDPRRMCLFTSKPILHSRITHEFIQNSLYELQKQLQIRGYLTEISNSFDSTVEAAVLRFQHDNGLHQDGVVGPLTWASLYYPRLTRRADNSTREIWEAIVLLQDLLQEEEFKITDPKGSFGKSTEKAVKRFQKVSGLVPDGIVGAWTWAVLWGVRQEHESSRIGVLFLHLHDFPFLIERVLTGFFVLFSFGLQKWDVLQVSCILMGIYFNQLDERKPTLPISLVTSLALVAFVPKILSVLGLGQHNATNPSLFQYAVCVLVGMFWSPILEYGRKLINR